MNIWSIDFVVVTRVDWQVTVHNADDILAVLAVVRELQRNDSHVPTYSLFSGILDSKDSSG